MTGYLFPLFARSQCLALYSGSAAESIASYLAAAEQRPAAKVRGELVPADQSLAPHLTNTTPHYRPRNPTIAPTASEPHLGTC